MVKETDPADLTVSHTTVNSRLFGHVCDRKHIHDRLYAEWRIVGIAGDQFLASVIRSPYFQSNSSFSIFLRQNSASIRDET